MNKTKNITEIILTGGKSSKMGSDKGSAVLYKNKPYIQHIIDVIQIKSQGRTMPLIAMYKKQCLHQCLTLLQNGEKRLRVAVNQLYTKTILIDAEFD